MLTSMADEALCTSGQVNDKNTLLQIFKNFSYNTEIGGEFKKNGSNIFNSSMERSQKSSMNAAGDKSF